MDKFYLFDIINKFNKASIQVDKISKHVENNKDEKPAEEKPAEEKPAEEKPAEEKPAEESQPDVYDLPNSTLKIRNVQPSSNSILDEFKEMFDSDNYNPLPTSITIDSLTEDQKTYINEIFSKNNDLPQKYLIFYYANNHFTIYIKDDNNPLQELFSVTPDNEYILENIYTPDATETLINIEHFILYSSVATVKDEPESEPEPESIGPEITVFTDTGGKFYPINITGELVESSYSSTIPNIIIKEVRIGTNVKSIGIQAFYLCSNLETVTIDNSVTSIGNAAFSQCIRLASVTIGNSVVTIGEKAFYKCSVLQSFIIPNSVTTIGKEAFAYCFVLETLTIPDSVTKIGYEAFFRNDELKKVYMSEIARNNLDLTFGPRQSFFGSKPEIINISPESKEKAEQEKLEAEAKAEAKAEQERLEKLEQAIITDEETGIKTIKLNENGDKIRWAYTLGDSNGINYDYGKNVNVTCPDGYKIIIESSLPANSKKEYNTKMKSIIDLHKYILILENNNSKGYGDLFYMSDQDYDWSHFTTNYNVYAKKLEENEIYIKQGKPCIIEVDLEYNEETKLKTYKFPLCPEKKSIRDDMLSNYQKDLLSASNEKNSNNEKLVLDLTSKTKYISIIRLYNFMNLWE